MMLQASQSEERLKRTMRQNADKYSNRNKGLREPKHFDLSYSAVPRMICHDRFLLDQVGGLDASGDDTCLYASVMSTHADLGLIPSFYII